MLTARGIELYPVDASGPPQVLASTTSTATSSTLFMGSWSPDGRSLAYEAGGDLWTWSMEAGAAVLHATRFREGKPEFSPNGRWLAYLSDESGEFNIYVRPFPGPGRDVRISPTGGREPAWSPDGRRLYFRQGRALLAVGFDPDAGAVTGRPELVFAGENHQTSSTASNRYYDVLPDGTGFVFLLTPPAASRIHVVYNWLTELPTGPPR